MPSQEGQERVTLYVCVICGWGSFEPPKDACGECGTEAEAVGPMEFVPATALDEAIAEIRRLHKQSATGECIWKDCEWCPPSHGGES